MQVNLAQNDFDVWMIFNVSFLCRSILNTNNVFGINRQFLVL